jgi:hypothetical protein
MRAVAECYGRPEKRAKIEMPGRHEGRQTTEKSRPSARIGKANPQWLNLQTGVPG